MPDIPIIIALYAMAGIVGLCFGSFATALVYRIPKNIPWVFDRKNTSQAIARSACPTCRNTLSVLDLVPVFSWIILRGRCRHCGAKIPARYPLLELTTMSLTILMFHAWGVTWASAPLLCAVPFLVAAVAIDWEHMILPDDINLSISVLALCHLFGQLVLHDWSLPILYDALFAAGLLTGLLWIVSVAVSQWKGRDALGGGDLKFLPAAGLMLGTAALPSYLALSGLLGVLTAVIKGKRHEKQAFPFGPALIISLYVHVFLTGLGFDYKW